MKSDPYSLVLDRLGRRVLSHREGQVSARCPAHDDHNPSLSVSRRNDGVVLLQCHRGCKTEDVLRELNLEMCDLYPDSQELKPARQKVSTHDYYDLAGVVRYSVHRYWPKDFAIQRGDGKWTMEGVERIPYRLPDLKDQQEIFIVEGEKDADALARLGLPATTNVGGAGKWTDDLAKQLRELGVQRVVVLPDNDDPGIKHGDDVAAKCTRAGMEARIVRLPGLDLKQDVWNWLANGGTLENLQQLAQAAPIFDAMTTVREPFGDEPSDETWFEDGPAFARYALQPPPRMLVQGLLPGDGVALLHGDPRSFKTWIALDMALAVASGTPALTTLATGQPSPVLYVSNEDGQQRSAERLRMLMRSRSLDQLPDLLKLAVHRVRSLDDAEWQARVCAAVLKHGVRLVILDPLRSVTNAVDQGPKELQPFADFFRRLAQLGCVVLLVHHDTKQSASSGSDMRKRAHRASGGGLFSKADAPIHAERVGEMSTVLLHPNSWKFTDAPQSLQVDLAVANGMASLSAAPTVYSSTRAEIEMLIVEQLKRATTGLSGNQLVKAIHKRREDIPPALQRLESQGVVISQKGKRNATVWHLAASKSVSESHDREAA